MPESHSEYLRRLAAMQAAIDGITPEQILGRRAPRSPQPPTPPRPPRSSVPGRCHGNYCPVCDGDGGGTKVPARPSPRGPRPLQARATALPPLDTDVAILTQNLREAQEAVVEIQNQIAALGGMTGGELFEGTGRAG